MAEANRSISQIHTIHITTAAHILAQLRARQAVKERRHQGFEVTHFAAREISALAHDYLLAHRGELMPEAIETAKRFLAGEFGKRAQRALRAKLKTKDKNSDEPKSGTSSVQNTGAKVDDNRICPREYRQSILESQSTALRSCGCEACSLKLPAELEVTGNISPRHSRANDRRYTDSHKVRSLSPQHPRLAEHSRRYLQGWCELPFAERYLGQH